MIEEFFLDKFEYDYRCNQQLCSALTMHDDSLSDFITRSFSHTINVHHIWIHRILGTPVESHTWDKLPLNYWERFCQENYLKTIDYLEKIELNT